MTIIKKVLLYFPTLLGVSLILSIPVGLIFTKTQYGSYGFLEMIGSTVDYLFNGTKISYMFFMWPLGILLGLPLLLSVIIPISIILLKVKFGTLDNAQIIASIFGIILMMVVYILKKKGYFNWFAKEEYSSGKKELSKIPSFVINFSIFAWVVFLTFFLSYYMGRYVLFYLSDVFKDTGSGSWIQVPDGIVQFLYGVPVTYTFFTGLLFSLFSREKSWNSHLFVLVPALLFSTIGGFVWLFWTISFFVFGIILSKIITTISHSVK